MEQLQAELHMMIAKYFIDCSAISTGHTKRCKLQYLFFSFHLASEYFITWYEDSFTQTYQALKT